VALEVRAAERAFISDSFLVFIWDCNGIGLRALSLGNAFSFFIMTLILTGTNSAFLVRMPYVKSGKK
jgi:hypothetical protein